MAASTHAEPIRDQVSVHLAACPGAANSPGRPGIFLRSHADSSQPDVSVFLAFFDCGTLSGVSHFQLHISILFAVS